MCKFKTIKVKQSKTDCKLLTKVESKKYDFFIFYLKAPGRLYANLFCLGLRVSNLMMLGIFYYAVHIFIRLRAFEVGNYSKYNAVIQNVFQMWNHQQKYFKLTGDVIRKHFLAFWMEKKLFWMTRLIAMHFFLINIQEEIVSTHQTDHLNTIVGEEKQGKLLFLEEQFGRYDGKQKKDLCVRKKICEVFIPWQYISYLMQSFLVCNAKNIVATILFHNCIQKWCCYQSHSYTLIFLETFTKI
eukprot:TRINITY_DN6401_c0_g1_i2.p2 TRINITY_DN6401_c0_g1~~TRINITY_DN6401_c0_g1_i2.p2  ORF type:complete len:242 (-),score=-6.20 TRINITY_DN6401_c0_g1_i2:785-1510(-)